MANSIVKKGISQIEIDTAATFDSGTGAAEYVFTKNQIALDGNTPAEASPEFDESEGGLKTTVGWQLNDAVYRLKNCDAADIAAIRALGEAGTPVFIRITDLEETITETYSSVGVWARERGAMPRSGSGEVYATIGFSGYAAALADLRTLGTPS